MSTPHYPHDPRQPGYGAPPPPGYGMPSDGGRTDLPGIFLIVLGVLNLFWGGYCIVNGAFVTLMPEAQYQEAIQQSQEAVKQMLGQNAQSSIPDKTTSGMMYIGLGLGTILASILMIVAGVRMRQLKSHGLAVFGSVLAMVPCVTCTGCCGIGQGVGIWALLVLLAPEVKAVFKAGAFPGTQGGMPYPPPPGQYPPPPGHYPPPGGSPPNEPPREEPPREEPPREDPPRDWS